MTVSLWAWLRADKDDPKAGAWYWNRLQKAVVLTALVTGLIVIVIACALWA